MKAPLFCSLLIWAPAMLAQQLSPDPARLEEIRALRGELEHINARLSALERGEGRPGAPEQNSTGEAAALASAAAQLRPPAAPTLKPEDTPTLQFFRNTTLAFAVDGYYAYNFSEPVGQVNLLRAYTVSSNSFSLNQANLIFEKLPTPQDRAGGRIDLQWGQATETLGGNPLNEQRPQVWRNLYQAYGTYLAPVGSGLQLEFGKFASVVGNEGNYSKDQIAYSRAFSFAYLPFYFTGLSAAYTLDSKASLTYILVNGAQQTEDFNGYKSQGFLWTLKPSSSLTWNVNYYFGQEGRAFPATLNPGLPVAATQPGLPTTNVSPAPNGREHIFDTYATWNAAKNLQLLGEADYVLNRTFAEQQPGRVVIGAFYAKYLLPRNSYVAARAEYFDDRGGLFSGRTQALKELTLVANRQLAPGFLLRGEYRRDFSNQLFFLSDTAGVLKHAQTTATMGLVYWWGTKQGAW